MAGVTDNGWVSNDLNTVVSELQDSAESEWNSEVATTPDSVLGQIFQIFGASVVDLYNLGQAITETQNRDTATGVYLNYLAALIGLSRLGASGSTGDILFTGSVGTTVALGTVCQDNLSRNIITDESVDINRASCYESTFSVNTVADGTPYYIVVEGTTYTYTSGSSATEDDILEGLRSAVNKGGDTVDDLEEDYTVFATVNDKTLVITYRYANNNMSTTNYSNITLESVGVLVAATTEETGELDIEAGSVDTLITTNIGIESITNPFDFETGREEETDSELRLRMEAQTSSVGTATLPAIQSSLLDVTGVTQVLMVENDTMVTNNIGQPAKSLQAFVTGGSDDDIGEVLWETKPAGIATYGTETVLVVDDNGDEQTVYFSRKTDKYAWVIITYSLEDDGSDFPALGEEELAEAVITYGEALETGEDFIPSRMYKYLYTVDGCLIDNIEIAVRDTDSEVAEPYTTSKIEVADTENLIFDLSRVTVTS